jgi:hypothetical protein
VFITCTHVPLYILTSPPTRDSFYNPLAHMLQSRKAPRRKLISDGFTDGLFIFQFAIRHACIDKISHHHQPSPPTAVATLAS